MKKRYTLLVASLFLITGGLFIFLFWKSHSKGTEMAGTVDSARNKKVLIANATVYINMAAPVSAPQSSYSYKYPDCGRSAQTDSEGNFKFKSLDPKLKYQLVSIGEGYQPRITSDVNATNQEVSIRLSVVCAPQAPPERVVLGRVVDPQGKPIEHAEVWPVNSVMNSTNYSWYFPGLDWMALTDSKGEFRITSTKPFESLGLRVSARNFADKTFNDFIPGTTVYELKMDADVP